MWITYFICSPLSLAFPLPPSSKTMSQKKLPEPHPSVFTTMQILTPLVKYGKQGNPHYRYFYLSEGRSKLVWHSDKKKAIPTQSMLLYSPHLLIIPYPYPPSSLPLFGNSWDLIDDLIGAWTKITNLFQK